MKTHHPSLLFMLLGLALHPQPSCALEDQKSRLIVLTDIGADSDDTMSMVRLMLYSDEIDIEGLIATTSVGQPKVEPDLIRKVVQAYGQVQPNLTIHKAGYPDGKTLLSKVKRGIPKYGMTGVGEGTDSEGSEWIIKVLERKDDRPLWISVWGGPNTLAQALYKLRKTKPEAEVNKLVAKLRVYTISDQDDSGHWMRTNFPNLFYIVSPAGDWNAATWTGIFAIVDGISNENISNGWLARNIQQNHGPLGAAYLDVAWAMEGDTPSWLALIPNGLSVPEHPDWGGWGGRYEFYKPALATLTNGYAKVPVKAETREIWTDTVDEYTPVVPTEHWRAVKLGPKAFRDHKVTVWRWREEFQNDFAARMDWCVKPYNGANHPPIPVLSHPCAITVKSGEAFSLDARNSTDPDGDSLSFLWFQYPEAGSYKKRIPIDWSENTPWVEIKAPEVDKVETVHFILKLTDKGHPPLTRYERVVVTIEPRGEKAGTP